MKFFNFPISTKEKAKIVMKKITSFRTNSNKSRDCTRQNSESRNSGFTSQNISDTIYSPSSRTDKSPLSGFSKAPKNLRVFTYPELKSAMKNFSRSAMIGEGGFGSVYRGTIRSSYNPETKIEIAVKQLNSNSLQGHKEWLAEVDVLGVADHPNLVKLIGYCAGDDERGQQLLLVYEYMPNKTVAHHLSSKSQAILSWPMRLKIALDAARGLTYLHEEMEIQIIFRDFKTSNILLDGDWNAKLSDFGFARYGPSDGESHVSTMARGTQGYISPDYIQSGRLTVKTDVWSYGVVLFELITGRAPIDLNRPKGETRMLEWIKPYLSDKEKFRYMVDKRLKDQYCLKSVRKLSMIAIKCLSRRPKSRPKMSKVSEMVQEAFDVMEMTPQPPLLIMDSRIVKGNLENKRENKRSLKIKMKFFYVRSLLRLSM